MHTFELGSDESVFVIRCLDGPLVSEPWTGNTLVTVPALEPESFGDIWVHTGEQWGPFRVTVETAETEPAYDDAWEDVVELSVGRLGRLVVAEMVNHDPSMTLAGEPGTYRVRVAARDRGARPWSEEISEEPFEQYLVQIWPAPATGPAVVRLTSAFAREVLEPRERVAVPGQEEGLASAAAIGRDVDRASGARELSGETGTVVVERRVPGTRRRHFPVVSHHICWSEAMPTWGFMATWRDDEYELNAPSYGSGVGAEGQLCGHGAIRRTLIEVDRPSRSVSTWEWLVNPTEDRPVTFEEMVPFLPTPTTVTSTLTQTKGAGGETWTDIRVEHSGVPVEWVDDLRAWREYQLAQLDQERR